MLLDANTLSCEAPFMADNGKSMVFTMTLDAEAQDALVKCMAGLPSKDKDGNIRSITPQVVCREALIKMARGTR